MKIIIGILLKNLSWKLKYYYNPIIIKGTLDEDIYLLMMTFS